MTIPTGRSCRATAPSRKPWTSALFRDYLTGLRLAVSRALQEGQSGAVLLETVRKQLARRYGTWAGFTHVDANVADVEKELTGTKAYPPAPAR